jgi:hypothetical protein
MHPCDVTLGSAVCPHTCRIFAGTNCLHVRVRKVKLKGVLAEPPPPQTNRKTNNLFRWRLKCVVPRN